MGVQVAATDNNEDVPILSENAPKSDENDGATPESPKKKGFLQSDWFSCLGGRVKTAENVETQPSVIKNDLSDDNDQSAEDTEPPALALVETSDEPEKTETKGQATSTDDVKSAVEETAEDQAAAVDAKVEQKVVEFTEPVEEKVQEKTKKSSIFNMCFSKPETKGDETIETEKSAVQEEEAPIDLTEKIQEAEKEIESVKNEMSKLSEKLPEIMEEPTEAADTAVKTQESAPVSKI